MRQRHLMLRMWREMSSEASADPPGLLIRRSTTLTASSFATDFCRNTDTCTSPFLGTETPSCRCARRHAERHSPGAHWVVSTVADRNTLADRNDLGA